MWWSLIASALQNNDQAQNAKQAQGMQANADQKSMIFDKRQQRKQAADAVQPTGNMNMPNLISGVFAKKAGNPYESIF